MPSLPLYQVDAFAERPFAGNPAAVCPLETPLPDALMQQIAAENNLSETAFVDIGDLAATAVPGDGLAGTRPVLPGPGARPADALVLRWFTPTVEVDLCGHATLATAFVLMTEIDPGLAEVTFRTRSGLLVVRRGAVGELVLDLPLRKPAPADAATAAEVAELLDARPAEVLRVPGGTLLAVLDSARAVRRATADLVRVARLGVSLCISAPGPDEAPSVDFVSRYFAPAHGIPEDPVTGSAHCFLTPFWAERLGKSALRARQVSRRGGELSCALAGDRVLIGGHACLVMTGTLRY
jgi:PhzF family phenazine biosynthesis protein